MSENQNGLAVGGVFAAFAMGALLGAGLTLLVAPRSGKETRDLVCKKTHDLKHAADEVIEQGKQMASEVQQKTMDVIAKGKEAAHEIGNAVTRST